MKLLRNSGDLSGWKLYILAPPQAFNRASDSL